MQKRIALGERYNVIMIDTAIEDYVKAGLVLPGSRTDIARSVIGGGVHAGLPIPDISSVESFKTALASAKSIGYSTGPSREYLLSVFERLGIAGVIKPKLQQVPSGLLVGSAIASGEVEIGFQQTNEVSHFPRVEYLGPIPPELQETTRRSGAVMAGSKVIEQGKALLRFISGPEAAPVIWNHGLEPL